MGLFFKREAETEVSSFPHKFESRSISRENSIMKMAIKIAADVKYA